MRVLIVLLALLATCVVAQLSYTPLTLKMVYQRQTPGVFTESCNFPSLSRGNAPGDDLDDVDPELSGGTMPVDDRMAWTLQSGIVDVFDPKTAAMVSSLLNASNVVTPILNLTDTTYVHGFNSHAGMLGCAFGPHDDEFYVYYTRRSSDPQYDNNATVSRFARDPVYDTVIHPETQEDIIGVPMGTDQRIGGAMFFSGDDNHFLFLGTGVGDTPSPGMNDSFIPRCRDWTDPHCGLLRLDVHSQGQGQSPFTLPRDNPDDGLGGRSLKYATGMAQAAHCSENSEGRIFCGTIETTDISHYQEVNKMRKGGDYGYLTLTGPVCYGPASTTCSTPPSYVEPVQYYNEVAGTNANPGVVGTSVIWGHFVDNTTYPGLGDTAIYADLGFAYPGTYIGAKLYILVPGDSTLGTSTQTLLLNVTNMSAFRGRLITNIAKDNLGRLWIGAWNIFARPFPKAEIWSLLP